MSCSIGQLVKPLNAYQGRSVEPGSLKGPGRLLRSCSRTLKMAVTIDEVMEQFPVTRAQVKAVLAFAAL